MSAPAASAAVALLVAALSLPMGAAAQDAMPGMSTPPATKPATPQGHASSTHARHAPAPAPAASTRSPMAGMDMGAADDGGVPPAARSGDESDGYTYGAMPGMDMRDETPHGMLLLDQLEYAHWSGGRAFAVDGEAWYGGDFNRLWLNFEGDQGEGRLQDLRTEALWSHAVAPFWDTQLGVRHDFGVGPGRTWAAFGVQGLAPYWFETAATFYVGQGGRTAARVEAEYELRFTQRLILQPKAEINLYGKDDPQRGIGSGLSEIDAGLRLRYEICREFAPYVGIERVQRFGHTAAFARAADGAANETRVVAGVRIWY